MIKDEHLLWPFGYDGIIYLSYDPIENLFYDQCGIMVPNIFEYLTPLDVYLFKSDHSFCIFPLRNNYERNILCEILIDE